MTSGIVPAPQAPPPDETVAPEALMRELPALLLTLLERRYLSAADPDTWQLRLADEGTAPPMLAPVSRLGRPPRLQDWPKAMPHLLTACHEPGHAVMTLLHGQKGRTSLYLGARRIPGRAARSTEEYLDSQASALQAYFSGLEFADRSTPISDPGSQGLYDTIETAPALAVVTGIPSGRGGRLPLEIQSLDRLVHAVGPREYALAVVAEPLDIHEIDEAIDACRRLKSDVHTMVKQTCTRSHGTTEGASHTERDGLSDALSLVPAGLFTVAGFLAAIAPPGAGEAARSIGWGFNCLAGRQAAAHARQVQQSESRTEASSTEQYNAHAEACQTILEGYVQRLLKGRSHGWWRTAVYIAADSQATLHSVAAALRSTCSGDATGMDPFRVHSVPAHLIRKAMLQGKVLAMNVPAGQTNPLGRVQDALATCMTSDELALLINMPCAELPGIPMRARAAFAVSVPLVDGPSVVLGRLLDSSARPLTEVHLPAIALNRHVFVTGMPGYGKTNTCMQLLHQAHQALKVPFLVIEPAKGEYRSMRHLPGMAGLQVYSIGGDSPLPLRLNPLTPVPGVPVGRHIDLLKAVFNASFPMYAGMPYVLEEALLEVYQERGWSVFETENPFLTPKSGLEGLAALTPNLEDLFIKIDAILERKGYAQEVSQNMGAALKSRLKSLMVGNKGLVLNTRRSTRFEDLFLRPTVVELRGLGDDEEKAFVMAVLWMFLYEYAELRQDGSAGAYGTLQHLTLVEEAHRLLAAGTRMAGSDQTADPRGKAVAMFCDLLAEMRAYGEGFVIADQSPTKLVPDVLKNSNLKLVHRLAYPSDRTVVGQCTNLDERQTERLNTLGVGIAVAHDDRIEDAILLQVEDIKARHGLEDKLNEPAPGPHAATANQRILHQHAGCNGCAAPCSWGHHVKPRMADGRLLQATHRWLWNTCAEDLQEAENGWNQTLARLEALLPPEALRCSLANLVYGWLQATRAKSARLRPDKQITPAERLELEACARDLAPVISALARDTTRTEPTLLRQRLVEVARILRTALQPPARNPYCPTCPTRCLMAPAAGQHLQAVTGKLSQRLVIATSRKDPSVRDLSLGLDQAPGLVGSSEYAFSTPGLLYCLLSWAELPPASAARRDEVLEALRQMCLATPEGTLLGAGTGQDEGSDER